METILFLAPTESDGTLSKGALEALAAAQELAASLPGSSLVAGLYGAEIQRATDSIAKANISKFYGVAGDAYAQPRYSTDAAAAAALATAAEATIILVPATARTSRVMAGVAHRLNGCIDTHVTAIAVPGGAPAVSRWFYRQRIEAQLSRTQRPWIILLDPGCQAAYSGEAGAAAVESVAVSAPAARTNVTGVRAPQADQQTIRPDAKLLFVAGAGWTKKQQDGQTHGVEAEKLILGFLKETKASLGGSKSLVELSGEGQPVLQFMTHLNQVGQTGATPRHPKGLSTCCHGEEPHVVGWRFITERRAINLDANCGWARGKADVLYVADAFEVMAKVNLLLAEENKAAAVTA